MITNLHIKNFFSFKDCSIDLHPKINILVGINGSGKSNLLKAIKLLNQGTKGGEVLNNYINKQNGGIQNFINKKSKESDFEIEYSFKEKEAYNIQFANWLPLAFTNYEIEYYEFKYKISIDTIDSRYYINDTLYQISDKQNLLYKTHNSGCRYLTGNVNLIEYNQKTIPNEQPYLLSGYDSKGNFCIGQISEFLKKEINSYSFFSTQYDSELRKPQIPDSKDFLDDKGNNLCSYLRNIKFNNKEIYRLITDQLKRVNPNFEGIDFLLTGNYIELMLEEKGLNSNIPSNLISDGTLKFLCLMAIFYNPNRGSVVCIDEPETGLHPDMLTAIADGIKYASETSQMIISTHSPFLLDHFALENVRVFEKDEENATIVKQLDEEQFASWSNDYSLGELWTSGHLGGNRW